MNLLVSTPERKGWLDTSPTAYFWLCAEFFWIFLGAKEQRGRLSR